MFRFESVDISRSAAILTVVILVTAILSQILRPQLRFIWHCFIRPLDAIDQKNRLDKVTPNLSFLKLDFYCLIVL